MEASAGWKIGAAQAGGGGMPTGWLGEMHLPQISSLSYICLPGTVGVKRMGAERGSPFLPSFTSFLNEVAFLPSFPSSPGKKAKPQPEVRLPPTP